MNVDLVNSVPRAKRNKPRHNYAALNKRVSCQLRPLEQNLDLKVMQKELIQAHQAVGTGESSYCLNMTNMIKKSTNW